MRTTSGEVRAEAIAADIGHVHLLWHGRYGALRVLFDECLVEEDEVGEAPARGLVRGLERLEVGLNNLLVSRELNLPRATYIRLWLQGMRRKGSVCLRPLSGAS